MIERVTRELSVGILLGATVWAALPVPSAQGQTAAAKPEFEVATIKPSAPLDPQKMAADIQAGRMPKVGVQIGGSRAEFDFLTMKQLLAVAYKVKETQVSGPAWLESDHFDIVAKMPDGSTKDDAPEMLRTLLEDRFKAKTHLEMQDHPVYALVVGKDGPKLKTSPPPKPIDPDSPLAPGERKITTPDGQQVRMKVNSDGSSTINMGERGIITQRLDMATQSYRIDSDTATMSAFADMLTNVMQVGGGQSRQVVDQTGLKGNYQVSVAIPLAALVEAARAAGVDVSAATKVLGNSGGPNEASDPGGGSTIFQSVQALGLRLESTKASVQELVVDTIEKTPTEN